jgi:hypothetical protein
MSGAERKRFVRTLMVGLLAGAACGLGVGLELVPPVVGIAGSVLVAVLVGWAVYRLKASTRQRGAAP